MGRVHDLKPGYGFSATFRGQRGPIDRSFLRESTVDQWQDEPDFPHGGLEPEREKHDGRSLIAMQVLRPVSSLQSRSDPDRSVPDPDDPSIPDARGDLLAMDEFGILVQPKIRRRLAHPVA